MLPYEVGKLFHLHILGLHGNPLGKDILAIYNEPNGSSKLLTYLLDNLTGEYHFIEFSITVQSPVDGLRNVEVCLGVVILDFSENL